VLTPVARRCRDSLSQQECSMVRDELGREDAPADSELDSMEDDTDSARANRTAARMAAPAGLVAQLMPFQEEGLAWMCAQEAPGSAVAGGILADEVTATRARTHTQTHGLCPRQVDARMMLALPPTPPECANCLLKAPTIWQMGMGKTIQAIAVILQRAAESRAWRGAAPGRGGTLVVAPVSAMTQWAAEISSRTLPGALSVLIWHGPDRRLAAPADLAKYDVVITSYAVLEVEWRRVNDLHKVSPCAKLACVRARRPASGAQGLQHGDTARRALPCASVGVGG
jgi:SNF2 family DNA or RNA helicase